MPLSEDAADMVVNVANAMGPLGIINAIGPTGTGPVALPDPTVAPVSTCTLGAATPFTLPVAVAGKRLRLVATQDGTGGRIPTFSGITGATGGTDSIVSVGGAVTLSTGAAAVDIITFESYITGQWVKSGQLNVH